MKRLFNILLLLLPAFGFLAHGVLGLLIGTGLMIGYFLVTDPSALFAMFENLRGASSDADDSDARSQLVESTMSILGELASVDGNVSDDEREVVLDIIDNVMGLKGRYRKLAVSVFQRTSVTGAPIAFHTRRVAEAYEHNKEALTSGLLKVLVKVAIADGRITRDEEKLIHAVAQQVGMSERDYEKLVDPYREKLEANSLRAQAAS